MGLKNDLRLLHSTACALLMFYRKLKRPNQSLLTIKNPFVSYPFLEKFYQTRKPFRISKF